MEIQRCGWSCVHVWHSFKTVERVLLQPHTALAKRPFDAAAPTKKRRTNPQASKVLTLADFHAWAWLRVGCQRSLLLTLQSKSKITQQKSKRQNSWRLPTFTDESDQEQGANEARFWRCSPIDKDAESVASVKTFNLRLAQRQLNRVEVARQASF